MFWSEYNDYCGKMTCWLATGIAQTLPTYMPHFVFQSQFSKAKANMITGSQT